MWAETSLLIVFWLFLSSFVRLELFWDRLPAVFFWIIGKAMFTIEFLRSAIHFIREFLCWVLRDMSLHELNSRRKLLLYKQIFPGSLSRVRPRPLRALRSWSLSSYLLPLRAALFSLPLLMPLFNPLSAVFFDLFTCILNSLSVLYIIILAIIYVLYCFLRRRALVISLLALNHAVFLDNIFLIESFRVEPAKIVVGALEISRRILRTWVIFNLEGVILVIFELLLAVHAHVGLTLLPWAVETSLIQKFVDQILSWGLLGRWDTFLLVLGLLMLLCATSMATWVKLGIRLAHLG